MDKESIEKSLNEIEFLIRQAQANYNALEGAKHSCLAWLDKISKLVPIENKE
jgi:hypothetical protein